MNCDENSGVLNEDKNIFYIGFQEKKNISSIACIYRHFFIVILITKIHEMKPYIGG